MPRDLKIFILAAAVATLVTGLSFFLRAASSPNWAVRVYLGLMKGSLIPSLQRYARNPRTYSGREGAFAIWFLTFFLVFMIAVFLGHSCGRQSC
jgi:hypothetical protein